MDAVPESNGKTAPESSRDGEDGEESASAKPKGKINEAQSDEVGDMFSEKDNAPAAREDASSMENPDQTQGEAGEGDDGSDQKNLLQMKLAEFFQREVPVQDYEKYRSILTEMKQQHATDSEIAQQQADELKKGCQEKLDEVEHEWRALMALKQDVALMLLSRSLGKQAAQGKVESALASEQLQQDQLIKLRLKNIKLKIKIQRLEADLYKQEEGASRPLQIRFEQLQAMRLEQKKQAEKQGEDSMKLQKKISSCLEVLSNVKEKLDWSQRDLQAKRDQLAKLEATVSERRDLLTWTKQACRGLQRSNLRLKEERGLLGNSILLRDFEDTVDACQQLEDKLENLRCRHEEIVFSCDRYKKKRGQSHESKIRAPD